jgi:glucose-1-phosphate adenylyltransferase
MKNPRVLALILAGGEGNRMQDLTRRRAKPALPFGGSYRLIDFSLSNCVHSHVSDTWVIEQFEPHSLNEHLANGRPWDLDRTFGGLRIVPPRQDSDGEAGWHQGNADALMRNRRLIHEFNPDLLLVLSSDHVYALDFREVIAAHVESDAEATMVTTRVEGEEIKRFGNPAGRC